MIRLYNSDSEKQVRGKAPIRGSHRQIIFLKIIADEYKSKFSRAPLQSLTKIVIRIALYLSLDENANIAMKIIKEYD